MKRIYITILLSILFLTASAQEIKISYSKRIVGEMILDTDLDVAIHSDTLVFGYRSFEISNVKYKINGDIELSVKWGEKKIYFYFRRNNRMLIVKEILDTNNTIRKTVYLELPEELPQYSPGMVSLIKKYMELKYD